MDWLRTGARRPGAAVRGEGAALGLPYASRGPWAEAVVATAEINKQAAARPPERRENFMTKNGEGVRETSHGVPGQTPGQQADTRVDSKPCQTDLRTVTAVAAKNQ